MMRILIKQIYSYSITRFQKTDKNLKTHMYGLNPEEVETEEFQ